WDTIYDNGSADIRRTTCAQGKNGLLTKGHHKFGDLDGYVAPGEDTLSNSAGCGRCVRLQYKSNEIYVFAIDDTDDGFIVGKRAMEKL
ncbi:Cerato-platanin, partial [Russula brevipes]